MSLVDLAYTPAERKEEAREMKPSPANIPRYPYGLTLRLEAESLKKLGMLDDLPEVGEDCKFEAVARVTSVSQRADEGQDDNTCVELQICQMALAEDEPAGAAETDEPPKRTVASYYGG